MTIAVENFHYRSTQYVVRPELKNFIEFAASKHYTKEDAETVALVRRAVDELINDPSIRVSVGLHDEADSNTMPANALREIYTAYNSLMDTNAHRLISFMLVSGLYLDVNRTHDFKSIAPRKHRLRDFSALAGVKYRGSQTDMEVSFMSVLHQLQTLVCTISDKVVFFEQYKPDEGRYYLIGRPADQAELLGTREKPVIDRFQVVIVLQLPKMMATTKRAIVEAGQEVM